jgi:hypothetical protein
MPPVFLAVVADRVVSVASRMLGEDDGPRGLPPSSLPRCGWCWRQAPPPGCGCASTPLPGAGRLPYRHHYRGDRRQAGPRR